MIHSARLTVRPAVNVCFVHLISKRNDECMDELYVCAVNNHWCS